MILKQDMPSSLHRVESAARLLEDASGLLKGDPLSQPARWGFAGLVWLFWVFMEALYAHQPGDLLDLFGYFGFL